MLLYIPKQVSEEFSLRQILVEMKEYQTKIDDDYNLSGFTELLDTNLFTLISRVRLTCMVATSNCLKGLEPKIGMRLKSHWC